MSIAITHPPLLLSLETSLGETSVALTRGTSTLAFRQEPARNRQTAELVPMIEAALGEAGVKYHQLTALACTTGPGSFTGIRTAIAVVRSLSLATGLPVFSCSTLQLLAFQAAETHPTLPVTACINAFRQQVYLQPFSSLGAPLDEAQEIPLAALPIQGETLLCGNAQELLQAPNPQATPSPILLPCAQALGRLASEAETYHPRQTLTPFYIRQPDAKLPTQTPLQKALPSQNRKL